MAANSRVSSRSLLNARLALTGLSFGAAGSGELALWVRNLTDEDSASNFIAFGPGFLHFYPRRQWRHLARQAELAIESEFRITPFIAVFVFRRHS